MNDRKLFFGYAPPNKISKTDHCFDVMNSIFNSTLLLRSFKLWQKGIQDAKIRKQTKWRMIWAHASI